MSLSGHEEVIAAVLYAYDRGLGGRGVGHICPTGTFGWDKLSYWSWWMGHICPSCLLLASYFALHVILKHKKTHVLLQKFITTYANK
jgi:hypothetical protein